MPKPRRRPSRTWVAALLAALTAVVCGLWLGEAEQVLRQAADICLACMGVG